MFDYSSLPREIIKAAIRENKKHWRFVTDFEMVEHARVSKLNFVDIPHMRFSFARPQECHYNCEVMAMTYADVQHVVGWSRLFEEADGYLLHSIVRHRGRLIDITPSLLPDRSKRLFAIDPTLTIGEQGGVYLASGRMAPDEILSREFRDAKRRFGKRVKSGMSEVDAALVNDDGKGGVMPFLIDVRSAEALAA